MLLIVAGYEITPGHNVEPALQSFQAAAGGGLFFALTIGTFLSLITVFWCQVFPLFSIQPKWERRILTAGVLLALLWCNRDGFNGFGSAYLVLIPLFLSLLAARKGSFNRKNVSIFFILMFTGPVVLLPLMGFIKLDRHMFINVRDNILLTNRAGQFVNAFYYRYTLFSAEAIKSMEQKQIRTVYLGEAFSTLELTLLGDRFSFQNYLPIDKKALADLVVVPDTNQKMTIASKRRTHPVNLNSFIKAPRPILQKISEEADNQRVFRQMIYWSLFIGMPLFIYGTLYQSVFFLLGRYFSLKAAAVGTAMACLVAGTVVMWPLNTVIVNKSSESLNDLITSQPYAKRLRGLQKVADEGLDISHLPVYEEIKGSGNMAERYWLAKILANSRSAATYRDLLFLLNDASPNVVCMALRSLGLRKNRKAIPAIVALIKQSNHWYVQWYAYNALKNLTWRQYALN